MIQDCAYELPVIERSSLKIGTFIDLATSTRTRADFTVIATCGMDDKANIYVLNILRGRWEWPDARALMRSAFIAEPGTVECVERAMHGLTALQEFERDAALLNKRIHGITVDRDKVSRAQAFAARASTGRVRLVQRGVEPAQPQREVHRVDILESRRQERQVPGQEDEGQDRGQLPGAAAAADERETFVHGGGACGARRASA